MKPACAALLLVLFSCTGCIGLDTTKSDAKPAPAEVSQRPDSVRPVNPDEITPGNARQAVNALWQELDRAEEP